MSLLASEAKIARRLLAIAGTHPTLIHASVPSLLPNPPLPPPISRLNGIVSDDFVTLGGGLIHGVVWDLLVNMTQRSHKEEWILLALYRILGSSTYTSRWWTAQNAADIITTEYELSGAAVVSATAVRNAVKKIRPMEGDDFTLPWSHGGRVVRIPTKAKGRRARLYRFVARLRNPSRVLGRLYQRKRNQSSRGYAIVHPHAQVVAARPMYLGTRDVLEEANKKRRAEAAAAGKKFEKIKKLHGASLLGPLLPRVEQELEKGKEAKEVLPPGTLEHLIKVVKGKESSNSTDEYEKYMEKYTAALTKKRKDRRAESVGYITAKLGGRITISKLRSKQHRDKLSAELTELKVDHNADGNWYGLTQKLKKSELALLVQQEKLGEAATWKDVKSFVPIAEEMIGLLGLG